MRHLALSLLVLAVGALSLTSIAETRKEAPATQPTTQPTTQASAPINTQCPVEGGDIDPAVTTVYKGETVAFCCEHCIKKFEKNPDKYMDKIKSPKKD